jgi:hypothetical protein
MYVLSLIPHILLFRYEETMAPRILNEFSSVAYPSNCELGFKAYHDCP